MDIVVTGRNVEVPEHFRAHVAEKLQPTGRLDGRAFRADVELFHEKNPRQASSCQRVEITLRSKGPVVRAEAAAETFYAALDAATMRLEARLRKAHDRRRVHHGSRTPPSVAEVTASLAEPRERETGPVAGEEEQDSSARNGGHPPDDTAALVVRDKVHEAAPMSTADALHEMELVGHDFFLFSDADTGLPSVVYRRRGYDYGVLRLAATVGATQPSAG